MFSGISHHNGSMARASKSGDAKWFSRVYRDRAHRLAYFARTVHIISSSRHPRASLSSLRLSARGCLAAGSAAHLRCVVSRLLNGGTALVCSSRAAVLSGSRLLRTITPSLPPPSHIAPPCHRLTTRYSQRWRGAWKRDERRRDGSADEHRCGFLRRIRFSLRRARFTKHICSPLRGRNNAPRRGLRGQRKCPTFPYTPHPCPTTFTFAFPSPHTSAPLPASLSFAGSRLRLRALRTVRLRLALLRLQHIARGFSSCSHLAIFCCHHLSICCTAVLMCSAAISACIGACSSQTCHNARSPRRRVYRSRHLTPARWICGISMCVWWTARIRITHGLSIGRGSPSPQ